MQLSSCLKAVVEKSFLLIVAFSSHLQAVQEISGPCSGPVYIATPAGSEDNPNGVEFQNQTVGDSCTVLVPAGYTVNSNNQEFAASTTVPSTGIVEFEGTSGDKQTNVNGKIGSTSSALEAVIMSSSNVFFHGQVNVDSFIFNGSGVAQFEHELNVGTGGVQFNDPEGVLQLNENVTLNGNVNGNLSSGHMTVYNNTIVNGNVSLFSFTFGSNSKVGGPMGVLINGDVLVQNITTNNGGININGNIHLGSNAVIHADKNITVEATGTLTLDGPVNLKIDYSPLEAPRSSSDVFDVVIATGGGASGYQVNAQTNDIRVQLVGANPSPGTITIQGQNADNPPTLPNQPASGPWWSPLIPTEIAEDRSTEYMVMLLPTAYANPGTDLDFIEGQIGSPTLQGYLNNLYQLYPIPSLIGVARESFNTTRQFQKVWLEHLNHERARCSCSSCQNSCGESCNDKMSWVDGFGYYGRQSNKKRGQGYKVNTWGMTLASDLLRKGKYCLGVGAGYAYSDLVKSQFVVRAPRTNTTKIHHYQFGVYGSYNPSNWFMDAGVSLECKKYNGTRYIYLPNTHRKAHSNYYGGEYSSFLTSGCECCYCGYEITPFASMIYSYLHQTSFHESGAKVLNLHIKSQNYHFLQSGLGLKVSTNLPVGCENLISEVHAIWLHDYIDSKARATARFSNLGAAVGYFSNSGPTPDDNTLNLGASITCLYGTNFSLLLNCDAEVSHHYYDIQGLIKLSYLW